jgi:hypothetical protein
MPAVLLIRSARIRAEQAAAPPAKRTRTRKPAAVAGADKPARPRATTAKPGTAKTATDTAGTAAAAKATPGTASTAKAATTRASTGKAGAAAQPADVPTTAVEPTAATPTAAEPTATEPVAAARKPRAVAEATQGSLLDPVESTVDEPAAEPTPQPAGRPAAPYLAAEPVGTEPIGPAADTASLVKRLLPALVVLFLLVRWRRRRRQRH